MSKTEIEETFISQSQLGVVAIRSKSRRILLHLAAEPAGSKTVCGRYDIMTCDLMPDSFNVRGHRTCIVCDRTAGQASWDDR